MDRVEFYQLLEKDPYMAHDLLRRANKMRFLLDWVRQQTMTNNFKSLAVLPRFQNDINKWKTIAKYYLTKIVEGDHDTEWDPKEPQGLWEMCFHTRAASVCLLKATGEKYLRGACLVRPDRIGLDDRKPLRDILKKYNKDVKEVAKSGKKRFISLIDWLKSHPELYDSWSRSVANRSGV